MVHEYEVHAFLVQPHFLVVRPRYLEVVAAVFVEDFDLNLKLQNLNWNLSLSLNRRLLSRLDWLRWPVCVDSGCVAGHFDFLRDGGVDCFVINDLKHVVAHLRQIEVVYPQRELP